MFVKHVHCIGECTTEDTQVLQEIDRRYDDAGVLFWAVSLESRKSPRITAKLHVFQFVTLPFQQYVLQRIRVQIST